MLDEVRLKCIFEPLEVAESNGGAFAWSGGVIFIDAMGFHAVVSHLEIRLRRSKQKVWNWHEVHYVPSRENGFPEPSVEMIYVVYIIFCFGNVATQPTHSCFRDYFTGRTAMDAMYSAKDITETTTQWKCTGRSTIISAALSTLFESHLKENMVVVNVNDGAHFIHLRLVSFELLDPSHGFFISCFLRVFGAHDIIFDLPTSTTQENLTMVLKLVYFDNKRRIAPSTSK